MKYLNKRIQNTGLWSTASSRSPFKFVCSQNNEVRLSFVSPVEYDNDISVQIYDENDQVLGEFFLIRPIEEYATTDGWKASKATFKPHTRYTFEKYLGKIPFDATTFKIDNAQSPLKLIVTAGNLGHDPNYGWMFSPIIKQTTCTIPITITEDENELRLEAIRITVNPNTGNLDCIYKYSEL